MSNLEKTLWGVIVVIVAVSVFAIIRNDSPKPIAGSVAISNEYHATTTSGARFPNSVLLQSGQGAFGSVVITGAAAGVMNFYDATTTAIAQRDSSQSSSTILIASIPASAAAGTYTFDQIFQRGLYVEIVGTLPTSTITFR